VPVRGSGCVGLLEDGVGVGCVWWYILGPSGENDHKPVKNRDQEWSGDGAGVAGESAL
jgi:hypothetical protein